MYTYALYLFVFINLMLTPMALALTQHLSLKTDTFLSAEQAQKAASVLVEEIKTGKHYTPILSHNCRYKSLPVVDQIQINHSIVPFNGVMQKRFFAQVYYTGRCTRHWVPQ